MCRFRGENRPSPFVQRAERVHAEGVETLPPQMVYVAEVKP
jgi:hypothetical protein